MIVLTKISFIIKKKFRKRTVIPVEVVIKKVTFISRKIQYSNFTVFWTCSLHRASRRAASRGQVRSWRRKSSCIRIHVFFLRSRWRPKSSRLLSWTRSGDSAIDPTKTRFSCRRGLILALTGFVCTWNIVVYSKRFRIGHIGEFGSIWNSVGEFGIVISGCLRPRNSGTSPPNRQIGNSENRGFPEIRNVRKIGDCRKFEDFRKSVSDRDSAGEATKYLFQIGGPRANPNSSRKRHSVSD